jgi:signal transduction histidine kinase
MPSAVDTLVARVRRVEPIRRDLVLAAGLFAAMLVDSEVRPDGHGVTPLGVLAAMAGTLPLAFRSRAPIRIAAWLGLATIPVLATLRPVDTVVLPVCCALFTVAATGDRRRSLQIAAGETALTIAIVVAFTPDGELLHAAVQNVGIVLAALALGDAVRWHLAYLASVREHLDHQISEERLRIARDLHDSIAHSMTTINVQAGAAVHLMQWRPDAAQAALVDIRRISGDALSDLRGTLGQLREGVPAPMRPAPSLDGLDDLVERVRAAGIDVSLNVRGSGGRLPVAVDAAAHRIVQEALTNVLRHSQATTAAVSVTVDDSSVEVEVSDNGHGAGVAAGATEVGGFGLLGMRERALSVGGSVDASPRPDGGWRVHATLPLGAT